MPGGLGGGAYGQTDVLHDRSYLIANLAHRNKAVRHSASSQFRGEPTPNDGAPGIT